MRRPRTKAALSKRLQRQAGLNQRLRAVVAAPHSTSAWSQPCLRSTTEPLTQTLLARTFRSPIFVPLERELGTRAERYERRNAGG